MSKDRKKRSFTLSSQADELLEAIAEELGISKTAVLEIAIREKAERTNISSATTVKQ